MSEPSTGSSDLRLSRLEAFSDGVFAIAIYLTVPAGAVRRVLRRVD